MKKETQHTNANFSANTIQIDLQKWLYLLLSYWWLFLLCLAIALTIGHTYLRYATFQYASRATLLIKEAGSSGGLSEENILLAESLSGGTKGMDNEIQILRSLTIMEKVVDSLKLNVSYFRIGNVKETELYKESPFLIKSLSPDSIKNTTVTFFLQPFDNNSFLLKKTEEEEGVKYQYDVPFSDQQGDFIISYLPVSTFSSNLYRIKINPIESVAAKHQARLKVERVGSQSLSSILSLQIQDAVPQKATDIINTLINIYNKEEIKDKNTVLRNTIKFIDNRVKTLTKELNSVETSIESFKSNNSIITENASASLGFALDEFRSSLKEISSYEVKKGVLTSLEEFLIANRDSFDLFPANLVSENPILSSLVDQYNGLVFQRKQLSRSATALNPASIALENELRDVQNLILQTIQNLKRDLQIPIDRVQANIAELQKDISIIPNKEKNLLEIKRNQTIKESLYLFLLQKREETALSEGVTTASTRVIDRARPSWFPVSPQRKLVLMASTFLGLFFPILFITLKRILTTSIESEDDLKTLTSIPIIGRIGHKKSQENIIVKQGDRSALNEMFRLLRTNLNFLNINTEQQVLAITSSISGEGKSFIAINLGFTLALSNKKVILIGLDLRKPKLSEYLGKQNNKGVTNYLIGRSSLEEIINQHEENANLHFIASGPIPPNPAELIGSKKLEELITELKKEYDYILIDTPPIGLVADALLLRNMVTNILIVVRHKYTKKGMVKNLEEMYQNQELEKSVIILNGIKRNRSRYGYGYGYGYGGYQEAYGEGYYQNKE